MAGKARVQSPAVVEYAERFAIDLSNVSASSADGRISLEDVRNARPMPYVTPVVKLTASQNDIDLRDVAGTGVGGRIRKDDVLAAAGKPVTLSTARDPEIDRLLAMTQANQAYAAARASVQRGPAFALNPFVDQVRAQASRTAGTSEATVNPTGPAPTLFATGDLPAYTASGIPPADLLNVPWTARHALAAAPTTAEAYAIMTACTEGVDGLSGESIAYSDYEAHPGNAAYRQRVDAWCQSAITDEQMDAAYAASPTGQWLQRLEEQNARAAKASVR